MKIRSLQHALRQRLQGRAQRRGFVLLAVLVFVLLLSMIVASLLFQTAADESAANASAGSEQAWSAALSGVAELLRLAPQAGGPELDWQDNPQRLKHQLVYEDGADQWYFTVFTPAAPDSRLSGRHPGSAHASPQRLRQLADRRWSGGRHRIFDHWVGLCT